MISRTTELLRFQSQESWSLPFQVALVVKNPPANAGDIRDAGSIPVSGRSPVGGPGNPLQHSCLENPLDRGAWWATGNRVAQSRTRWSNWAHTETPERTQCTLRGLLLGPCQLDSLGSARAPRPAPFLHPGSSLPEIKWEPAVGDYKEPNSRSEP